MPTYRVDEDAVAKARELIDAVVLISRGAPVTRRTRRTQPPVVPGA